MEPSEVPAQISKDNFLEVPSLSESFCEDEEVKATFKPGFSPQPSRRGSESSEEVYLDTPTSGSRRVSFADSFGFNLVSVKEFDSWDLPSVSPTFELRKDVFQAEEYVLSPLFDLPCSKEALMQQLQEQKAILESTEFVPGCTSMKGIIRVLNVSFEKLVYVRMSLDDWQTHYDILAEYVPNSCDGETDQFSFKISLVPPYQKDGSKVEFCIRYETSAGTFWSNNNGTNYVLVCQKKEPEPDPAKPLEEVPNKQIKGCLKIKPSKEELSEASEENNFENSKIKDTYIPTIVCSHEDKELLESSYQNVKAANVEHDEHNEKELELMVSIHQRLARCDPSEDERNTFSSDPVNFPSKAEELETKRIGSEVHTDSFQGSLFPSSSAESSSKDDHYHSEKYSSGNETSHRPSAGGEINRSLGDTARDESVQSHISNKAILDDNANPAYGSGRGDTSCPSTSLLMTGSLNKKYEGGAKDIEIKDGEYLPRDCHWNASANVGESTENRFFRKDCVQSRDNKVQRIGFSEKPSRNVPSVFYDQETKMGHLETTMEVTEAGDRDRISLPSKDSSIPSQEIMADTFQCARTFSSSEETGRDVSAREDTPLGGLAGQECSPSSGDVLRHQFLFQVEQEKLGWLHPEGQGKSMQHQPCWNAQESQGKARGSKINITEQIKEQADCEDMWGKRDNTGSLKATPAETLFTCQETADYNIPGEAEAGTAYIIKTTSERIPESMSAGEKAVIAKLPQETARSDRPIKVKEAVFDPHEGRSDEARYTLCQRDTVSSTDDNGFENVSRLDICNVRADERQKEEAANTYSPGKRHDRETCGIGNITSVEESLQVITSHQKATSKWDSHLEMPSAEEKSLSKNGDLGQVQELPKKTEVYAPYHSAFTSDLSRASQNDSLSHRHEETAAPPWGQARAGANTAITTITQTSAAKSEHNCKSAGETQGRPECKPEESSRSPRRVMSDSRIGNSLGQIFQLEERSAEISQGPTILISESREKMGKERHGSEGLINSGQSLGLLGDKEFASSSSASFPVQESQDEGRESLLSKYTNSQIPYFLLFLVFLITVYHYDLMIGLAFFLCSLCWLYWEEGKQKESVKRK
ncbi:protein phosphatase 1 regulatory subunit 3A [Ochotona curzoniae]|uniref:protein phosphatase 1 regulatory subunit 3A n=1 Tax=Ochotona curzoniae TaxID=130825 RepID=UPI001B3519F2|nr:protein phosphatase 1 regulatory subunit 3A [Ochotona curzoniae]